MTVHVAGGVLVRDGRGLLVHRHPDRRWYPDCWDVVGGHIEAGESAEQALVRECREEIGVDVEEFRPLQVRIIDRRVTMTAFLVTRWRGEPTNTAPGEHNDLAWFTAAEIAGLTLADPASRAALCAAAESACSDQSPQPRH